MEKNKSYIGQLAAFAYDLRFDNIPEDVLSKVKLCIIDALECCLSSLSDERTLAADYATSETAGPCLKICTGKKAGMADAAYFNTVKGSITNRNDLQIDSAVHAGAVIIPTVLAVGQHYRLS
ncbi:MAG: MmgE/PrpD family protein, partial [Spirochaetales bacterium]|nr:MmgE/PrpD family protein [Spirochaetales bacterium]